MYTRIVELTCTSGKAKEVCRTVDEKVMPILKKQQGFRDEITLASTTDPDRVLAISFWDSREEAERYHREQFSRIAQLLEDLLETDPMIDTYNVETSTTHRISSSRKAA